MNSYAKTKRNLAVTFGANKHLHSPINECLGALEPHAKFLLSLFLLMLFNNNAVFSGVPFMYFCNVVLLGGI